MKKTLVLLLTVAFAFAVPMMAGPSYDSTVMVNISPDTKEIILSGDSVDVTYTIGVTNISKSGDLPQIVVKPFGDNTEGLTATPVTKIAKGKTVEYTFTVTYTEVGEYFFWVNIKNMQGNSGKWNYEFTSDAVNVTIIAPPASLPDGFFFDDGNLWLVKNILGLENIPASGGHIVKRNGVALSGNSDSNANSWGIQIKSKVLETGTYEIVYDCEVLLTFEIAKLDGLGSIINVL